MEGTGKKTMPVLMILTAAAGWGIIGMFTRPLSSAGLSAFQITFIRCIITALAMGLYLAFKNPSMLKIKLRDIWMFLGTGILSIIFFNVCYFLTIEHTTLATASLLLYTAPCFVMIMSAVIFKEKITPHKLTALVAAFLGCGLAAGFTGENPGAGVVLTGIGSGLGYASYSIFSKLALRKYNTYTIVFYTFIIAAVCLALFCRPEEAAAKLASDAELLLTGGLLGTVSTFIPYILYTKGLLSVEAGKASVLAFAEPMVAAAAGIAVFGETLNLKNSLGMGLIFISILLLSLPEKHLPQSIHNSQ